MVEWPSAGALDDEDDEAVAEGVMVEFCASASLAVWVNTTVTGVLPGTLRNMSDLYWAETVTVSATVSVIWKVATPLAFVVAVAGDRASVFPGEPVTPSRTLRPPTGVVPFRA